MLAQERCGEMEEMRKGRAEQLQRLLLSHHLTCLGVLVGRARSDAESLVLKASPCSLALPNSGEVRCPPLRFNGFYARTRGEPARATHARELVESGVPLAA